MRIGTTIFSGILCLSWVLLVPGSFAGDVFTLVGGKQAVIEGNQLILIEKNSRRSVAPSGRYDTRDGRYSIIVKEDQIVIRDHTKELR